MKGCNSYNHDMRRSQTGYRDEWLSQKRLKEVDDHMIYSQEENAMRERKNRQKENRV